MTGAIVQADAALGPALMIVAKAVGGVPPTSAERLSGKIAATSAILVVLSWTKVGVTVVFAEMVTLQVTPLHPPPDHPAKVEPAAAVAVKVIGVPVWKLAVQVAPQLMPDGLLVTVPEPLPAGVTDSMKLGITVKVAVTVVLPVIVTVHSAVPLHPSPLHPVKVEPEAALAVNVTGSPVI